MGFGLIIFGVLALVLPFVGLQHRAFAATSQSVQVGIGIFFICMGGISLALSYVNFAKLMSLRVVGIVAVIGTILVTAVVLTAAAARRQTPGPFATPGRMPRFDPPIPPMPPISIPFTRPSEPVAQADSPTTAPQRPGVPSGNPRESSGNPIKIKLSNARTWREQNPQFPTKPVFTVDYKVEQGLGRGGLKYVWVIQAAGTRAQMDVFRLQTQGRLEGSMFGPTAPAGPYECYLALDSFGMRGRDMVKISDTVTFQEVAGAPTDPAPQGTPLLHGAIAATGGPPTSTQPAVLHAPHNPPEPPKPLTDDEITSLILDMKSRDAFKAGSAAAKLAKQTPVEVLSSPVNVTPFDPLFVTLRR